MDFLLRIKIDYKLLFFYRKNNFSLSKKHSKGAFTNYVYKIWLFLITYPDSIADSDASAASSGGKWELT